MLGVLVSTFTPQDRAVRIFFHSDKRYVEKILHDEADEALKLMKGNFFWRTLKLPFLRNYPQLNSSLNVV